MTFRWFYWVLAILTALMWAAVLIAPGGEAG
jgi:hypothetical protein